MIEVIVLENSEIEAVAVDSDMVSVQIAENSLIEVVEVI